MSVIGEELDSEVYPMIYNYLDIIDSRTAHNKYLNHISDVLGNPPDILGTNDSYRNMLRYIVSVYKIKGTSKAYQLFFSLLGYDIDIIELGSQQVLNTYDGQMKYDDNNEYDINGCNNCTQYDIVLYRRDDLLTGVTFDDDFYNRAIEAVRFNEPINTKLRNIYVGIRVNDVMPIIINDTPNVTDVNATTYDSGLMYDNDLEYDTSTGDQIGIVINNCIIRVTEVSQGHNIKLMIPINNLDLTDANTIANVKAKLNNNEVYNSNGNLTEFIQQGSYLEATVIQPILYIPEFNELRLEAQITTTINLSTTFAENINVGDNALTLTFQ